MVMIKRRERRWGNRAIRRLVFAFAVTSAAFVPVLTSTVPAQASGYYYVTASPYLNVRSMPSTSGAITGTLPYNTRVLIYCQYRSDSSVNGSTIWDFIGWSSDGRQQNWVSDYWMSTPNFNDFSDGLPNCGG